MPQVFAARLAVTIANGIEASQIGERLARAKHVIRAHCSLGIGEINLYDFRAHLAKVPYRLFDLGTDLGSQTLCLHEGRNNADAHARNTFGKICREIGGYQLAGAIKRIVSSKGVHGKSCILNVASKRANLVKGGTEGHYAVTGNHAICRLHGNRAAEAARLTDGTARIRAQS